MDVIPWLFLVALILFQVYKLAGRRCFEKDMDQIRYDIRNLETTIQENEACGERPKDRAGKRTDGISGRTV